jgi:nicotinamide-nucleotide amidase
MPEINRRQAMVPAGGRVIPNAHGSAPGLWIEDGSRVILLLPGPPRELKPMLAGLIDDRLRERSGDVAVLRRVIRITGRIESHTDEALQPLYREWADAPVPVLATILAALGQIELHLSVRATAAMAGPVLDEAARRVVEVLGDDVFSTGGESLEAVVGRLLAERGLTIAAAESCTGGLFLSRLTDVAGSSRYVQQGIVAYSNDAKIALLGVPPGIIDAHGAVSLPVAEAMALGARRGGADVGVGITGIAGPGGGSAAKPVGTVAIAVSIGKDTQGRTFRFLGEREPIKFQSSQAALDMVRRRLTRP